jgi:putative nucleotidyltransferase with HDIG domain
MGPGGQGAARSAGYFPRVAIATLVVTVLPGLAAGVLQAAGLVHGWLPSALIAVALSMVLAAMGSAWWARRPASRDIVFADLMLWGWLRRVRTERRLTSARWLLGRIGELDEDRRVEVLERLSAALEARDSYTHGHSKRVTRHSFRIARQLGLPDEEAARIRTAAAVHDVGKIDTPREVLNKPGRLTDEEFAVIKRHPVDGARMVTALGDDELTSIVLHHHERLDGGGYPDGLVGGQIPLGARVIAVADTFDALTSNRPYRPGCRHKKALDILRAEAGTQLDPDVVAAFLSYYSGRKVLPWWSAAAAAPSRLASWVLSGLQGATVAPLGGGAASLGAAFLVGASLAGAPEAGQAARPGDGRAVVASAAGAGPDAAGGEAGRPAPAGRRRSDGSARTGGGRTRDGDGERRSRGRRGLERPGGGDSPGGGPKGSPGSGGGSPGGGQVGGETSSGGGGGSSGGGGGDGRLPRVETPGLPETPGGGGGDRPRLELPRVEVPEVKLPKVELRPGELPSVEVPSVELPRVEVPGVELPRVEVPGLPPIQPKLPPIKTPPIKLPPIKLNPP